MGGRPAEVRRRVIRETSDVEGQTPTHRGAIVRDDVDGLGLSVVKAAGALAVWPNQRNNVVSGKSNISPAMDVRLEMAFGGTADTWPRAQNNYDIAQARKVVANIQKIVPKNKEPA